MDNEDNLNVYINRLGESHLEAIRADGWMLAYCIRGRDNVLRVGTDATQKGRDALQLVLKRLHDIETSADD